MLSANEAIFNEASVPYQEALVKSGYTFKLKYEPPVQNVVKAKRRRNILWFNPSFSETVQTNFDKQFFIILAK